MAALKSAALEAFDSPCVSKPLTRSPNSAAALTVKLNARIESAVAPRSIIPAIRAASTAVLPVPGPAITMVLFPS